MSDVQNPSYVWDVVGINSNNLYAVLPYDSSDISAPSILVKWDGTRWALKKHLERSVSTHLELDEDGRLWFRFQKALEIYEPNGRSHQHVFGLPFGESSATWRDEVLLTSPESAYFAIRRFPLECKDTVWRFQNQHLEEMPLDFKVQIFDIAAHHKGRIWLCGDCAGRKSSVFARFRKPQPALISFDGQKWHEIRTDKNWGRVLSLAIGRSGELLIGTRSFKTEYMEVAGRDHPGHTGYLLRGQTDQLLSGKPEFSLVGTFPCVLSIVCRQAMARLFMEWLVPACFEPTPEKSSRSP